MCWGNMLPGTREPGEGEARGQRESLVSSTQLPFDLRSVNFTSVKARERQEVKTMEGKLKILTSTFTLGFADIFANVN